MSGEDSLGGPPTSSGSSPFLPSSRVSSSTNLLSMGSQPQPQQLHTVTVMSGDLDTLIKTLQDHSQRDDLKLKALQDIWNGFDVFSCSPAYVTLMENLVRCFLKLFSDTTPQFIQENNTQQLRKLMLEIILRTSGNEIMRQFSKQIHMHMLKVIQTDNEVNAILAVKILVDHVKLYRQNMTPEITMLISHLRKCFYEMAQQAHSGFMFENRSTNKPSGPLAEDLVIESSLQQCFVQHQVNLDTKNTGNQALMYQLIPRASQSVKVLGEVVTLVVLLSQMHKTQVQTEVIDFGAMLCNFINVRVPTEITQSENRNQDLVNEFHNAQVKALTFFAFMIRSNSVPIVDSIIANGDRIVSGIVVLLETCPILVVNQRKELLSSTKFFVSYEPIRSKFLPVLPRLFSERLMIGTAFTCYDNLRSSMYSQLADLIHHLRSQLTYPMLCHASFVFSRCLHDPLLPPQTQSMAVRLIMNLCESFTSCEARNGEPCRDVLFGVLEHVIFKLRVLVLHHLPALFAMHGEGQIFRNCEFKPHEMKEEDRCKLFDVIQQERKAGGQPFPPLPDDPALTCSVESVPELEPRPAEEGILPPLPHPTIMADANKPYTPVEGLLASTWTVPGPPISLLECRNMVKFLLHASKYLVSAIIQTKRTDRALTPAEERDIFVRLFKYGIMALDVFLLNPGGAITAMQQQRGGTRSREEKETVEYFGMCLVQINPEVFTEIFSNYIDFLIERVAINSSLQILCSTFLVNTETSARFGGIFVSYLLRKLPDLAVNTDRSALCLKMFKIIFSAIPSCPDIERTLRPHLHNMVREATFHALLGREPLNYFLLLRALFRSIGGGHHDILYQQFLPLLPSLLSMLNRLQSTPQRQQMREVFVELCLTVPVRLSSLLPYLPLLMDPLVCALNGSLTLVQQGLRTLELCVDNLQPEYLYEHIAPVRAALMQGLWKTVGTCHDTPTALNALRILGKFGGSNRKMLCEPQPLSCVEEVDAEQMTVVIEFDRPTQTTPIQSSCTQEEGAVKEEVDETPPLLPPLPPITASLPLSELAKTAVEQLRLTSSSQDERFLTQTQSTISLLRSCSAELGKSIILSGLNPRDKSVLTEEGIAAMRDKLQSMTRDGLSSCTVYRCADETARNVYVNALTAIAFAVCGKDLRMTYVKFFTAIVRQLTLQAVMELIEPPPPEMRSRAMDGCIVVDAIEASLSDPNKDFVHAAVVMLRYMCDTCMQAVGEDVQLFCSLPILSHLVTRLCASCYGSSWFSRLGGATVIQFVIDEFPRPFIRMHLDCIVRALTEIPVGLSYEISSGAVDAACSALEKLAPIVLGLAPLGGRKDSPSHIRQQEEEGKEEEVKKDEVSQEEKEDAISKMVKVYVPLLFNADPYLQKLGGELLTKLSSICGYGLSSLLSPSKLPSLIYSSLRDFCALSLWRQMAAMNAIVFALRNEVEILKEKSEDMQSVMEVFARTLVKLCEEDDEKILSRRQYQPVGACSQKIPHASSARDLRQSALRTFIFSSATLPGRNTVSEFHHPTVLRVTLEAIGSEDKKLRETAEESILEAHSKSAIPDGEIQRELRKLVEEIESRKELSAAYARRFCILVRLNGTLFDRRCYDVLMAILRGWDERTRRSSAELRERSSDDVDAMESVLQLLPHVKTCVPTVCTWMDDPMDGTTASEEENNEMASTSTPPSQPCTISLSSPVKSQSVDASDFVPVIGSLCSTMHAAFCIPRQTFFSSGCLVTFLCAHPIRTLRFFLSSDSLSVPARRSLFKRIFEHDSCSSLRSTSYEAPSLFHKMLRLQFLTGGSSYSTWNDMQFTRPLTSIDDKTMEHELLTLWMIDSWSRNDIDTFIQAETLIRQLQEIWRSDEFKSRYMVKTDDNKDDNQPVRVQLLNAAKYEVPKLFASIFIRYLRRNFTDVGLFCDLLFVFIGSFATDFSFVRAYLRDEVIPTYPLWWRRTLFEKVMEMFEKNQAATVGNLHVVRIIQYALTPVIQYSFERYEVEEVVGPRAENSQDENENLVVRLANVIHSTNKQLSDTMTLAMYHLSSLIVSYAHHHIHINKSEPLKQSNRLRTFMLFAWPCLSSNSMDVTLKYMGHLFLAHIIERFSINRKIVLQVYHSLTQAHQQDNRDIIKKAIDILTPAVPQRMDDGLSELLKVVRKSLSEESHNLQSVFHCLQMVTRNYRVYFPLRHELVPLLIGGISRMTSYQTATGYLDGRRLSVEVCEMILKWELLRQENVDRSMEKSEETVERVLENLKKNAGEGEKETTTTESTMHEELIKQEAGPSLPFDDPSLRPISKEHADNIVNILLKISTTPPPASPQAHQQATIDLNKRSLGLLRAALKPKLWGENATMKIAWLEKQLTVTSDIVTMMQTSGSAFRGDQQTIQQHFLQAQQSLEVLVALVFMMPKSLVVATLKPLQKAITACLGSNYHTVNLSRSVVNLISRLLERMEMTPSGMEEFDVLNQFIAKFITEQFLTYEKNPSAQINHVFPAFNILRTICQVEPAYLDAVCLQPMIKVLLKAAREYAGAISDTQRDKNYSSMCDMTAIAIEMLRPRVIVLSGEMKRTLATQVLLPFCDTISEKLVEGIIRITKELIVTHTDELSANPGLSIVLKLYSIVRVRFRQKTPPQMDIVKSYLQLVLYVFEDPLLSKTEYASKLEEAFYWGLSCQDDQLRSSFLSAFERNVPRYVIPRLEFIFATQDWSVMKDVLWIRHALFLLLRCASPIVKQGEDKHGRIRMGNAATFGGWKGGEGRIEGEGETMQTDAHGEAKKCRLSDLLMERRAMLREADMFDPSVIIEQTLGIMWIVPECSLPSSLFVHLFSSIWNGLSQQERAHIEQFLPNFISSATHTHQSSTMPVTSLAVIMDAVAACQPKFQWNPSLVKYVSTRHRAWHRGLLLLEEDAQSIPSMEGRMVEESAPSPQLERQLDVLENLATLYSELGENDQAAVVWKKRAFKRGTINAITFMQKGEYERASDLLEELQLEYATELEKMQLNGGEEDDKMDATYTARDGSVNAISNTENEEWTKMWIECSLQLARWGELEEYANSPGVQDARLLIRAAAHRPEPWLLMRQCKEQLSACLPPDFTLQFHMYASLIAVMDAMGDNVQECKQLAEKACEDANHVILQRWRQLPSVVAVSHVKILQCVHMLQDLQESYSLTCHLHTTASTPFAHQLITEMKGIVKTWRFVNRCPPLLDDLASTMDMYNVRKRLYSKLIRTFDEWILRGHTAGVSHLVIPTHSMVHTQLNIARAARKAKMYDVAAHHIYIVHAEPAVPVASMAARMVEQVKLLRAHACDVRMGSEVKESLLKDALMVTEDINVNELAKDSFARIYTQKGAVLSEMNRRDDAYEIFKEAAQLTDLQPVGSVYANWGKHMDDCFHAERSARNAEVYGVPAIQCFVEAARLEPEHKTKKYIAKAIWTVRQVAEVSSKEGELVPSLLESHARSAQTHNWIQWLPQLCLDIKQGIGCLGGFVAAVARAHPLHAFHAMRQMTTRVERRKEMEMIAREECTQEGEGGDDAEFLNRSRYTIFPTLQTLIGLSTHRRPSDVFALEKLLCAIEDMREFWAERQLRYLLRLQDTVFSELHGGMERVEDNGKVMNAMEMWKKELERRREEEEMIKEGEVKEKGRIDDEEEFIASFSSTLLNSLNGTNCDLLTLSNNILEWRKRLEDRIKSLPKELPLRLASEVLADFCGQTANVDMFSELFSVRSGQYMAMISRFGTHYELGVRGGKVTKRISVRAQTGKILYYMVTRWTEPRAPSRIPQVFSLLNTLVQKEKTACVRFLSLNGPMIVQAGMSTLIEHSGKASSSLFADEILSRHLEKTGERPCDIVHCYEKEKRRKYEEGVTKNEAALSAYRIVSSCIPSSLMRDSLLKRLPDPTHFYTLRKTIACELGVYSSVEYSLRLTSLLPQSLHIHVGTAKCTNGDSSFDLIQGRRSPDSPVPFRLTPNILNLLGMSLDGHFAWSLTSMLSLFYFRSPLVFLRPLIWDTITYSWPSANLAEVNRWTENVCRQIETKMKSCYDEMSTEDGQFLIQRAIDESNRSKMAPSFHSWF